MRVDTKSVSRPVSAAFLAAAALVLAAAASAAPPVTVLSPMTLTVQAAEPTTETLTVRNDGSSVSTLQLTSMLDAGSAQVQPTQVTIPAFGVKAFQVTITADRNDRSANGQLVLTAPGAPPAAVPVVIEPEQSRSWSAALLIFVPLLGAAVLVIVRLRTVDHRGPFGPANWDYSESWATSLTLVGALLGTVLGAGVLPDNLDLFSKAGYAGFNVLFGMLVVVAPLVYAAGQRRIKDSEDKKQQYQGTTLAFALASIVTLWGVFGELATIGLLYREIEKAGELNTFLVAVSWGVLSLVFLVTVLYSVKRMRQIAESEPADKGTGLAAPGVKGTWSLL